ncbi:MAG: acylphosphatase [Lacipirellulaceae bacterium]
MTAQHVRRRVVYSGRVQGVGFRATTQQLAADWPVVGWVRNLDNGTVELLAEGSAGSVAGFLAAVRGKFARNLTREAPDDLPAGCDPPLTRFSIRH